ncbi:MAG: polysaccharide deacetylase family protein [Pseudomonadota bacterium]
MSKISVTICLLFLCFPAHAGNSCVVLQYHHFGDAAPAITSVTLAQFDAHLQYLEDHHFTVMPLRGVVAALRNRTALPEHCVSITVDDAYLSVYRNAYPRLKQRGWPLTVFVNTQGVDQEIPAYMSWEQMREMSKHGVTFENHGHGHIHMIRRLQGESEQQWSARISEDIRTAQQRITQETGVAPQLFAHPYGEYTPATLGIIEQMGLVGFGQQSGPVWPGANFGALPRFPMAAQYADMSGFKIKANTLPLPVIHADPVDPLTPAQQGKPLLTVTLKPGSHARNSLQCFISGSNDVELHWSVRQPDQFTVTPNFELKPGRHRTNCTMAARQPGRFHWYSHNHFVRKADGGWYPEY